MANGEISNGNGATKLVLGLTRELFLASVTIISALLIAGIVGMVILYGEFQAMKVSRDADHALIVAQGEDIKKLKSDLYAPRFSTRTPLLNSTRPVLNGVRAASQTVPVAQ